MRSDSSSPLSTHGARTHAITDQMDRLLTLSGIRDGSDIPDNSRQDHPVCDDRSRDDIPHGDTGQGEAEIIHKKSLPKIREGFFLILHYTALILFSS